MLSDVMEHFGLRRSLRQVGYFATEHHHQILKDLRVATREQTTSEHCLPLWGMKPTVSD
jgi:hypothetical protein